MLMIILKRGVIPRLGWLDRWIPVLVGGMIAIWLTCFARWDIMLSELAVQVLGLKILKGVFLQNSFEVHVIRLDTRGSGNVAKFEASGSNKHFHVPWICLVREAFGVEPDHSVQDSHLLITIACFTKVPFDDKVEMLLKGLSVPTEPIPRPEGCEVISVDYD